MTKSRDLLVNVIRHHLFIPICLLSGVFLRMLWIWLVNPDQVSDFVWFENRAESIASGHGYSVNGIATAYWPVVRATITTVMTVEKSVTFRRINVLLSRTVLNSNSECRLGPTWEGPCLGEIESKVYRGARHRRLLGPSLLFGFSHVTFFSVACRGGLLRSVRYLLHGWRICGRR